MFLSCQVFLIKKLVDKVLLALASDKWCLANCDVAVSVCDTSFFDSDESHLYAFLCRHVPVTPIALDEITMSSEPIKQAISSHVDPSLLE